MDASEIETGTETMEYKTSTIDGETFRTSYVYEFCKSVAGTDVMFPMKWTHKYDDLAEVLIERDIVGRTASGSWFEKDESELADVFTIVSKELFDDVMELDEFR